MKERPENFEFEAMKEKARNYSWDSAFIFIQIPDIPLLQYFFLLFAAMFFP
jgi:hypothetical protein